MDSELWHEHKEATRQQHVEWHTLNRNTIDDSGIPYTDKGESLLFREQGKP